MNMLNVEKWQKLIDAKIKGSMTPEEMSETEQFVSEFVAAGRSMRDKMGEEMMKGEDPSDAIKFVEDKVTRLHDLCLEVFAIGEFLEKTGLIGEELRTKICSGACASAGCMKAKKKVVNECLKMAVEVERDGAAVH